MVKGPDQPGQADQGLRVGTTAADPATPGPLDDVTYVDPELDVSPGYQAGRLAGGTTRQRSASDGTCPLETPA